MIGNSNSVPDKGHAVSKESDHEHVEQSASWELVLRCGRHGLAKMAKSHHPRRRLSTSSWGLILMSLGSAEQR